MQSSMYITKMPVKGIKIQVNKGDLCPNFFEIKEYYLIYYWLLNKLTYSDKEKIINLDGQLTFLM